MKCCGIFCQDLKIEEDSLSDSFVIKGSVLKRIYLKDKKCENLRGSYSKQSFIVRKYLKDNTLLLNKNDSLRALESRFRGDLMLVNDEILKEKKKRKKLSFLRWLGVVCGSFVAGAVIF